MLKTFEASFPNGRKVSFQVRGICKFDILNPCWDNRQGDIPGQHWGGGKACAACTKEAAIESCHARLRVLHTTNKGGQSLAFILKLESDIIEARKALYSAIESQS